MENKKDQVVPPEGRNCAINNLTCPYIKSKLEGQMSNIRMNYSSRIG